MHVSHVHTGESREMEPRTGSHPCEYYSESFELMRSLSQHVCNKHAAAKSARLAGEGEKNPVNSQPRHWDEGTVEKFIKALFTVGTGSNVEIARHMGMVKMAQNVKGFKTRFLRNHPDWRVEYAHLGQSPETEEEEEQKEVIILEEGGSSMRQQFRMKK